jgi:hypothetical protein
MQVLSLGRVEQFMPHEQLVAEGDLVNDIFIVLEGQVSHWLSAMLDAPDSASAHNAK